LRCSRIGTARSETVSGRLPIPASALAQNVSKNSTLRSRREPPTRARGGALLVSTVDEGPFVLIPAASEDRIGFVDEERAPLRSEAEHRRHRHVDREHRVAAKQVEQLEEPGFAAPFLRRRNFQIWRHVECVDEVGVENPEGYGVELYGL
jgi:hypothetical protein